jgi:hypothetical protein
VGVLEGVREGLLHHPVGRDLRAAGRPGAALLGELHRLAGLRERIDLLGGEFTAAERPGGGFVVRATIPAGSAA